MSKKGCGKSLAEGQWWGFCGETDMGQSLPSLCVDCGGKYILEEGLKLGDKQMKIIKGQEAICPDGLGRVVDFEIKEGSINVIIVETYFGRSCARWNHKVVELIDPRGVQELHYIEKHLGALIIKQTIEDVFVIERNDVVKGTFAIEEDAEQRMDELSKEDHRLGFASYEYEEYLKFITWRVGVHELE